PSMGPPFTTQLTHTSPQMLTPMLCYNQSCAGLEELSGASIGAEKMTQNTDKEQAGSPTPQTTSDTDAARRQLEAFRKQKDKFFSESEDSPILHEDRHHFHGLNYYPVDLTYRVDAVLIQEPHPGIFKVQTTTGDYKEYTRLGRLEFELNGQ